MLQLLRASARIWVPFGLLLLSQLAGWLATLRLLEVEWMLASVPPTVLLIIIRLLAIRYGDRWAGRWVMHLGWLAHTLVVLVASAYNPFTAIYAFLGYLDSRRWLRRRWVIVGVVTTALLSAFGQSGGLLSLVDSPWFFAVLAVVNIGIATAMMRVEREREEQVEEREQIANELAEAHQRNLELHQQLLDQAKEAGISQERARLSREIHDTVAQGLVAVIRQLEAIPDAELAGEAQLRVERAEASARGCLDEARRAVAALAPRQLERQSLAEAVRDELAGWSERAGIPAELVLDGEPPTSGINSHDHVVLRVVQESLSNVAKHAGDCRVTVSLSWQPQTIMVDVNDDGAGFEIEAARDGGHGLAGMAARVSEVSGEWSIESQPGKGCTVSAVVPR